MSMPPITVLMPVYNAQEFIRPAIKSILDQSYRDFELLIIDDGSDDDTSLVIQSFTDPRIRYLTVPHSGLGNALNFGLQQAAHPIIARMDADDISFPDRLEKQLAAFLTMPFETILSCRYVFFTGQTLWGFVNSPTEHEAIRKRLPLHNEITHTGVMYHRDFILGNGGYTTEVFEDYELWLRLEHKAHFHIMPEPLVFIQYRKNSLSRRNMKRLYSRVYRLTKPLFEHEDSLKAFGLSDKERKEIRGWREYFFGDPAWARAHWGPAFLHPFSETSLFIAYFVTLLPSPLFIAFKESRFRFRLDFIRKLTGGQRKHYKALLRHYLA